LHGGAGGDQEDDWAGVNKAFDAFAGPGGELDGREFLVMVGDCGLLGGGFAKTDVDVVFTGVARKARKIGFDMFKDCVRKIAQKRKEAVYVVQDKIASSSGPQKHGVTKTDAVRFHDDKSTYTGAHAGVHDRADGHGEDRHARLAAQEAEASGATEDEHPWDAVLEVYYKFAGDDGIDSREFAKLCLDCSLYDKKFGKNDVDIVFTSAAGKGVRKLNSDAFCAALRKAAGKKGCPVHEVQKAVAASEGPVLSGTKADAVRFHDDKSTYTGAHAE